MSKIQILENFHKASKDIGFSDIKLTTEDAFSVIVEYDHLWIKLNIEGATLNFITKLVLVNHEVHRKLLRYIHDVFIIASKYDYIYVIYNQECFTVDFTLKVRNKGEELNDSITLMDIHNNSIKKLIIEEDGMQKVLVKREDTAIYEILDETV